jgi:PKD repeat protein
MRKIARMVLGILFILANVMIFGCGDDENNSSTGTGQPTISGMTPSSVSIGQQNIEGSILGSNLNGVTGVSLGDGMTLQSFNSASASEIRVVFSVNDNAAPGAATISVEAVGGSTSSSSVLTIMNNKAPKAKFTIDPPAGSLQTTFSYDGSLAEDDKKITSWSWDFGDGAATNGKKVTHKYKALGTYKVKLTVGDAEGVTSSNERNLEIKKNSPPIARFSMTPENGDTVTTFRFNASRSEDPDGRITDYRWSFGDGARANGHEVTHVFEEAGRFDVELTVEDNKGEIARLEREVEVEKSKGRVCSPRPAATIAHRAIVESFTANPRVVTVRFVDSDPCQAYYRCGDVRIGGLRGWGPPWAQDKWIGVMCKVIDLGGGRAQITLAPNRFNYGASPGDEVYTWGQKDCSVRDCNGVN